MYVSDDYRLAESQQFRPRFDNNLGTDTGDIAEGKQQSRFGGHGVFFILISVRKSAAPTRRASAPARQRGLDIARLAGASG